MKNDFNFCPMCGKKNIVNFDNRKWVCSDCNFELYSNVASAVGIIIYDDDSNVLFEVRVKNPRKGFLAIPGGFTNADETLEEAAKRECMEEIGITVDSIQYLCSFPNTYPYRDIEYKTCDCFFIAKLAGKVSMMKEFISTLHRQESEVLDFATYCVKNETDIEKIPIAFDSTRKALKEFINKK